MGFIHFCLSAAVVSAMYGTSQAVCSPCPFQWMENRNYCYRYLPENLSYTEAGVFCKQFSHTGHVAELATVTSLEELTFIMAYIDAVFNHPPIAFGHNYIWLNNNTKNDAGFETHADLILYKRLGRRTDDQPCSSDIPNNTEYDIVGNQDLVKMVPAPDVVGHACAVYAEAGSYLDLGDFKDTCISDPSLCESMTWSLWLNINTSSGFTGARYYISSGGQTQSARGIAFFYKSVPLDTFGISIRTEQMVSVQSFERSKIPLDQWFHMVIAVDLATSDDAKLMLYVDGVLVAGDEVKISKTFPDGCTKLYLGMSNTCGTFDISLFSGSAAYSNLAVYDGLLTPKQINGTYTCGSPDWELTLRDLIMKSDLEYECTASDLPGPTITWSTYHKQTDSWENLDAPGHGYTIQSVNESTCVLRSTLVIGESRGSPMTGDVVGCTAHRGSLNTSAYMYLGDGVTLGFRDQNASGFAVWAGRSSIVYTGHRSNRTNGYCATDSSDHCTLDQEKYPFICKIEH